MLVLEVKIVATVMVALVEMIGRDEEVVLIELPSIPGHTDTATLEQRHDGMEE